MSVLNIKYSNSSSLFYLNSSFSLLKDLVPQNKTFIITDENVFSFYGNILKSWSVIVVSPGESSKSLKTIAYIIAQLVKMDAGRDAFIVGLGGGVVCDISGFAAGIYKRGVSCAFIPTTILAMVDASIGGKNGLDFGGFKNMIGLIRQPSFLLYDYHFLTTLPQEEWINGFAEIIKHACILDEKLFYFLENNELSNFQNNQSTLAQLIQQNVSLKTKIVQEDELEMGNRMLLNFGHTFGHAIEALYNLPHGKSVAIGMNMAAKISAEITGFEESSRVSNLIRKYKLPTSLDYDQHKLTKYLMQDKKRIDGDLSYVLLNKIGDSLIKRLTLEQINSII